MVDVALQLQAEDPGQRIVALSRGGLLPHAHRTGGAAPSQGIPIPDATPSLLELLRFVRTAAVVAEVGGGDWRDAVNALRPSPRSSGQRCPRPSSALRGTPRPFLGHPPAPPRAAGRRPPSTRCARSGQLDVRERADPRGQGAAPSGVEVTCRSARARARRHCERRPSSTAPGRRGDVRAGGSRLLETLCAAGTVRPHPLALGLDTPPKAPCAMRSGRESETLFAIGPLRRGELWETTAVPEIRAQAQALAAAARAAAPPACTSAPD